MDKKTELRRIKSIIIELSAKGKSHNPAIQASSGKKRHYFRNLKKAIGQQTRAYLLAYALLRGIPYRALEPRCKEDCPNYLRTYLIYSVLNVFPHGTWISKETILEWMESKPKALAELGVAP